MHEVVFVVEKNGAVSGLISDADLEFGRNVKQAMQAPSLVLERDAPARGALRKMAKSQCSVAPVVHEGRLCGVLSYCEVMLALEASIQLMKEIHAKHREVMLRASGNAPSWDSMKA